MPRPFSPGRLAEPVPRRFALLAVLIASLLCSMTACSDGSTQEGVDGQGGSPAGDGLIVSSAVSEVHVGEAEVAFSIETRDGQPVEGALVKAEAWMPAHGHGTASPPRVQELGGGRYEVQDLVLSMPGVWELLLSIEYEDETTSASLDVLAR